MILLLDSLAMYIDNLLVTFSYVRLYYNLVKLDVDVISTRGFNILNPAGILDILIKILGLALTLTIWPSAMIWADLITALVIVIPRLL